jgi:hypothetical protein
MPTQCHARLQTPTPPTTTMMPMMMMADLQLQSWSNQPPSGCSDPLRAPVDVRCDKKEEKRRKKKKKEEKRRRWEAAYLWAAARRLAQGRPHLLPTSVTN